MLTRIFPMILIAASASAALANGGLTVSSPAFKPGGAIPDESSCDGANTAPPLAWTRGPAGTKSYAILVEDPDAPNGTYTHWIVTGLPPDTTSIAKGGALPNAAHAATNDKGTASFAGMCPPSGTHHYHFKVFALDMTPTPPRTANELRTAIGGHVLAQGEIVGTYQRHAGH